MSEAQHQFVPQEHRIWAPRLWKIRNYLGKLTSEDQFAKSVHRVPFTHDGLILVNSFKNSRSKHRVMAFTVSEQQSCQRVAMVAVDESPVHGIVVNEAGWRMSGGAEEQRFAGDVHGIQLAIERNSIEGHTVDLNGQPLEPLTKTAAVGLVIAGLSKTFGH